MRFWDYRELSDRLRWSLVISSISIVILANATAVVLSSLSSKPDLDGFFATTLIAISSCIVHTLQLLSTLPKGGEFLQVRKVLFMSLVAAFVAHAIFIILLHQYHDQLFVMLSKLLCLFHGVFADNITNAWGFLHAGWTNPRCLQNFLIYALMAIQLGLFSTGVWALLYLDIQVVWCIIAIPLWIFAGIILYAFLAFCRTHKTIESEGGNYLMDKMHYMTYLSGLAALTSTILACVPATWEWHWLFYLMYGFLKCLTSWKVLSLFIDKLITIVAEYRHRRAVRQGRASPDSRASVHFYHEANGKTNTLFEMQELEPDTYVFQDASDVMTIVNLVYIREGNVEKQDPWQYTCKASMYTMDSERTAIANNVGKDVLVPQKPRHTASRYTVGSGLTIVVNDAEEDVDVKEMDITESPLEEPTALSYTIADKSGSTSCISFIIPAFPPFSAPR